jgi:hypothetical protein
MTSGELASRARRVHLAACSRQYFAYDDMTALTLSERNSDPRACRPMGTNCCPPPPGSLVRRVFARPRTIGKMMFHKQPQFLANCGIPVTVSMSGRFGRQHRGPFAGGEARPCSKSRESASSTDIQAIEENRSPFPVRIAGDHSRRSTPVIAGLDPQGWRKWVTHVRWRALIQDAGTCSSAAAPAAPATTVEKVAR